MREGISSKNPSHTLCFWSQMKLRLLLSIATAVLLLMFYFTASSRLDKYVIRENQPKPQPSLHWLPIKSPANYTASPIRIVWFWHIGKSAHKDGQMDLSVATKQFSELRQSDAFNDEVYQMTVNVVSTELPFKPSFENLL